MALSGSHFRCKIIYWVDVKLMAKEKKRKGKVKRLNNEKESKIYKFANRLKGVRVYFSQNTR